jgi:hypothetical protein
MHMSMNTVKAIVTVVLVLAFGVLIAFLLSEVGVSQSSWERYVYLLSGVEAVVFAAVGWLFGKEVHREQAQKAEAKAEDASAKHVVAASEAAAEKAKGLALARAILAHIRPASGRTTSLTSVLESAPAADVAPLAALARETYPELSQGESS